MFAATLAIAAMTTMQPVAPVQFEIQELRTGCHPYRTKTPACDNAAGTKNLAAGNAEDRACHPDPVKSRICKARERDTGNILVMRTDPSAAVAN